MASSMYGTEPDDFDPGRLRSDEDYDVEDLPICDECSRPINFGAVSLAGVGIACSHKCMNRLCLKHEQALSR